jgi:hypothetical protein
LTDVHTVARWYVVAAGVAVGAEERGPTKALGRGRVER